MFPRKTTVAVIGGGLIGTAIAYFLARRNVDVVLLESQDLTSGSSGACDGAVFMQTKKVGIHLTLARKSLALLSEIQPELPVPIEFENHGGLVVIETDEEMAVMKAHVAAQRDAGFDVTLLDPQALRALAPHLSHHLIGAAWSQEDSKINPIGLTLGFAMGAKRHGAAILTGQSVTGIEIRKGRVEAVVTPAGRIATETVVNATGVLAPVIGKMAGIEIPIRPRRGQILVTREEPGLLPPCLTTANYIAAKFNPEKARSCTGGVSIDQTRNGNLLLGATREFVGYDRRTTPEALGQIAANACRILPGLQKLALIRAFAGLRPYTPDGLPILGPVGSVRGLIMAAGHEGDGVALSAITGKLISQLIIDGRTETPLDRFALERFNDKNS